MSRYGITDRNLLFSGEAAVVVVVTDRNLLFSGEAAVVGLIGICFLAAKPRWWGLFNPLTCGPFFEFHQKDSALKKSPH